MNIIGKWKVKELLFPTPNGMVSYTPENLPDGAHADEIIMMLMSRTEFTEDGFMNTLMRVPEDKIELAKSQGRGRGSWRDGRPVRRNTGG